MNNKLILFSKANQQYKCEYAMYGGISLIENPVKTVQLQTMKRSTKSGLHIAQNTKAEGHWKTK